jgi:YVTN family beta-propeller protein
MVGAAPSGLAVGGGWVWVTNRDDGTVTGLRLDGEPGERIPVGTAPTGIAYDSGAVWVADSGSGAVVRLDPALGSVKRIKTGNGPQGVAVSAGHVWVSNSLDATVSEIDPDTDTVVDQIPVGPDPTAIVAAAGEIWVANTISDTVSRIDTRSGHALPAVPVQDGPDALAVSGGSLWVANGDSSTVSHINTTQARVTETFSAGLHPRAIAVAAGTIWVADSRGSMVGLDPSAPTRRIRAALTGVPVALASTADGVWATVEPPLTGHRGGTLRALGEFSPPDPIDPAISFTPPGWQVLTMTNDGLTSFRRVSGPQGETVVPDLASMIPQPTDGGLTYTFELRRGVRYSTGRPLRAGDFRRALERVFDAGVGDGYYDNIVGAAACEHRPPPVRCQLRRGIETDDSAGTVRFHLVHADPDFPAKLALPFADAVPSGLREPPFCAQPRCGYSHQPPPVPATGPYMVVSTNLRFNTRGDLMLVRNPQFHEWSAAAQPAGYPDRIAYHFGQTPQREASQVEEGTADWSSDGAPPKTLAHLSATIPTQIHRNGALGVFALTLDTRAPPFTSRLARQAVNYAINRTLLTSIAAGTTADLACQVLPPGMLGYVPYCPYTKHVAVGRPSGSWLAPDVERARRLVKESGTEGVRVTFSLVPTGINSPAPTRTRSIQFGETVVAELRSIGYNAQLRLLSTDIPPVGAQMATMWWFDDYPAPSDFLQLFFSCNHRPTAFIPTQFCDPTLDRQMAKAVQLQPVDLTAAAARWANVDHDMTDQAPWVALYTPTNVDVVSRRVGNYQYNPQSWILLDQLWVR